MKHIYLVQENFKGSVYGVGTYVNTLIKILITDYESIAITVVNLFSDKKQVLLAFEGQVRHIYIPQPSSSRGSKNYYQNSFYILSSFIKREEENIIHIQYRNCRKLTSLLKEHFNFKVILTWHFPSWLDYFFESDMKSWFAKLKNGTTLNELENSYLEIFQEEKLLLNDCDLIIAIAQHASTSLEYYYNVSPKKIQVIYNSLSDQKKINSNIIFDVPCKKKERTLLFIGRLDQNKNPFLLIKSFERIKSKIPVRIIIAGAGSFDLAFMNIYPNFQDIILTGFLEQEKLITLYKIADIGIIPSHYEEFGYVAVEMMMHGLPIIANRTSGLAEIIEDDISGKLLNLYDDKTEEEAVEELANAIIDLLEDTERQERFSRNARQRYLDYFGIETFKDKMLTVYNEI